MRVVDLDDADGVAPMLGAAVAVMHHPAIPAGATETHVFKISQRTGDVHHNEYVGLFEPTQDFGITEQL